MSDSYLLLRAASQVHGEATLLSARGEFPVLKDADFPYSEEARRYFRSGPPLLQRYLPFWAANLVDRMWIILVPILGWRYRSSACCHRCMRGGCARASTAGTPG